MSENTLNAYLTIRFEGPEIKSGRMRLDDFIQAAREFSACAKRMALALQLTPSTAKGRRPEEIVAALSLDIVGFTRGSPAAVAHFERSEDQMTIEMVDFGESGVAWTYDYWENLPAAEYARRQGVRPVSDFAMIFGAGVSQDWDGFDEAVERWRAENPEK